MKKIYIVLAAILLVAAPVTVVLSARSHNAMDDFFRANLDALSQTEALSCPDPYDVKNYMLDFKSMDGCFVVDLNGEITIAGKKISLGGFGIGAHVKVSYILAHCALPSEGNCCPNSRNGDIQIVGYSQDPDCNCSGN